ncbi:hypothetical protein GCM10012286_80240 [Streptomyces lasiicapitis]|uniref:Uncharacterized protein n=1 Tax=Streptomyces lasiicapitis TaxID=1923961 RepID=A0ABQ2MUU0_9ACTN|nr:hypothetical protein GCM10012286_80240 [Streptomyces lasiicapitis]
MGQAGVRVTGLSEVPDVMRRAAVGSARGLRYPGTDGQAVSQRTSQNYPESDETPIDGIEGTVATKAVASRRRQRLRVEPEGMAQQPVIEADVCSLAWGRAGW